MALIVASTPGGRETDRSEADVHHDERLAQRPLAHGGAVDKDSDEAARRAEALEERVVILREVETADVLGASVMLGHVADRQVAAGGPRRLAPMEHGMVPGGCAACGIGRRQHGDVALRLDHVAAALLAPISPALLFLTDVDRLSSVVIGAVALSI